MCAQLTIANPDGSLCFFPTGLYTDGCAQNFADLDTFNNLLDGWYTANNNDNCAADLDQDLEQNYHIYSSCACSAMVPYSLNGYTIGGYTFDSSKGALFTAEFPGSSAYVTSVGATQFVWDGQVVVGEVVASIEAGSFITTGGGFSLYQQQPSYQTAAVNAWAQANIALPPAYAYDTSKRGYPDISFNGHYYVIAYSTNGTDQCPCALGGVDGTSCSSPALGGLMSLINDKLLNAGKSPLGFLNPLLYQMAAAHPAAFNDISTGNNKCSRAYCCLYGYTATTGWDPASGLGSPDFPEMEQYILQVKGVPN